MVSFECDGLANKSSLHLNMFESHDHILLSQTCQEICITQAPLL